MSKDSIPDPYPTPEAYEKHMQGENERLKLAVEAEKQRRMSERIRQAQQAVLAEKMDKDNKQRRDKEFLEAQTFGMNPHQKKTYERLMQLQSHIESSSGNQREDYQAEYAVLIEELVKEGRIVGTSYFVPATVLINVSGNGVVDDKGKYHDGTFSAYQTTPWLLEKDKESGERFLTKMGVIDKTNILIKDKIKIVILDKTPEPVPNKSVDLFPKKQELGTVREPTKAETEKKKKGLFR